jgi:hypothetical protein
VPDCDQHFQQQNIGYFSMKLDGNIGNTNGEMHNMDQIFHSFMEFVFGDGMMTEEMRVGVSGIFVRAEQKESQRNSEDCDPKDLPGIFRFELWIRDVSVKLIVKEALVKWRESVYKVFGIENERKFKISFRK